ncbi:uncharacterized protein OCT59_019418 [Rhizophagus irregularis]|uniref:uncharacterized protein n=1 Tax=Rhizophagus irregularis TaxID=588596 RepID=UPI0033192B10|nr:hypothetical protein OCT59_019418 [Rhizophagus irregularis]
MLTNVSKLKELPYRRYNRTRNRKAGSGLLFRRTTAFRTLCGLHFEGPRRQKYVFRIQFQRSRTPKDFNFEALLTFQFSFFRFPALLNSPGRNFEAWTEFSTWFSGSHLDWTGFRRLTASCNPPEKNFEDASWMKFRRSRMLPDFHIEGKGSRKTSSGLPYRRSQGSFKELEVPDCWVRYFESFLKFSFVGICCLLKSNQLERIFQTINNM